jgi:hypothetical protein
MNRSPISAFVLWRRTDKATSIAFFVITLTTLLGLIVTFFAFSQTDSCGTQNQKVLVGCKAIAYKDLPQHVKQVMKKLRYNVKTGSNDDYGYALDLNNDGLMEYAFCCMEAPHGPCNMKIFGKVSGKWKSLSNFLYGYDMESNNPGFTVLLTQHNGYFDICQDGQTRTFKNGLYR